VREKWHKSCCLKKEIAVTGATAWMDPDTERKGDGRDGRRPFFLLVFYQDPNV
jgi:hypothetical protein